MNDHNIEFDSLTAEEAGIVSGGANTNGTPQFGLTSTGQTTEGKIMNANGSGQDVTVYSAKNPTSTTPTDEVPYKNIALPPY